MVTSFCDLGMVLLGLLGLSRGVFWYCWSFGWFYQGGLLGLDRPLLKNSWRAIRSFLGCYRREKQQQDRASLGARLLLSANFREH